MNNKNKILVGCLALLLVLSVGYALFSDTITINGTVTAKGNFQLTTTCINGIPQEFNQLFVHADLNPEGGYQNDTCSVVDDEVSLSTEFLYPGAVKYFTVKMTNTGTIDAQLYLPTIIPYTKICSADNKEGENQTCKEMNELGDSSNYPYGEAIFYSTLESIFETEDGTLISSHNGGGINEGFITEDGTTVTLNPGESTYFTFGAAFNKNYEQENFYINYSMEFEFPWEQVTN